MSTDRASRSRKIDIVQTIQVNFTENYVIQLAAYSVAEQSNVPPVISQNVSGIQKDPQSSDTGDAVAMDKTTQAEDVALNVCSQQDSFIEDPVMKILAMLQTNRQEIADLASVVQAGNEAVSTSIREIRKEMAANQESLKQVSERFNSKLEASIAADNRMTGSSQVNGNQNIRISTRNRSQGGGGECSC
jgi:hypothetical protein